jgi:hypothetical protein
MTNIFSSKSAKITELSTDNAALKVTVAELTAKVDAFKNSTEEVNALKTSMETEHKAFDATIETMKAEFNTAVTKLQAEVETLTKAKAEVETKAKAEVEQVKAEATATITEKVMEGVATKISNMGITEAELPKLSTNETKSRYSFKDHISKTV